MVFYSVDTSPRKLFTAILAILAVVITYLPSLVYPPFLTKFGPLSTFGVFGLLFLLFDSFLWRFVPIVGIPYLAGVWTGTIVRGVHPGETDGKTSKISIQITQTWTRMDVVFKGTHSFSTAEMVSLSVDNPNHIELSYAYRKRPKVLTKSGQKHSTGYTRLTLDKDASPKTLIGPYFSDEYRGGSISVAQQEASAQEISPRTGQSG